MDTETYNKCRDMLTAIEEVLDYWIAKTSEKDIIEEKVNND